MLDRRAHAIELTGQLGDAEIVAQDHLVADDQADDVRMTVGDVDRGGDLRLVRRELAIEPGAERDLELMARGDVRDLPEALQRRVRAHRRHFAGEQSQIGVDLLGAGQRLRHRVLAGAERRERHALHVVGPRRLGTGPVQPGPQRERQRRENGCDDNAGRSHRVNVSASGEEYTRCANRIFSGSVAAAAALLCLASPARAADEPRQYNNFEFTPFVGYMAGGEFEDPADSSDRDLDADNNFGLIVNAAVGLTGGTTSCCTRRQSTSVDGATPFDMDVQYLQIGGTVSYPDADAASFRTSA